MEKDKYNMWADVNENWEQEWRSFISNDHHYDGDFLIRLITHKLELMSQYFNEKAEQIAEGKLETDSDVTFVIASIDECYELGLKILTYNYGAEADEVFSQHNSMIWLSSDCKEPEYIKWVKLTAKADKERKEDIELFFKNIARYIDEWWV